MLALFESNQALLDGFSNGVASSGVVEFTKGLGDVVLCKGGAHVDGHIDTAMDRFWLLACMYGKG